MMHELTIAGQYLTVRSPADAAYVRALAAGVEERVRRAEQQGATTIQAWMLVALGLADELNRLRETAAGVRGSVSIQTDELLALLSQAAKPTGPDAGRKAAVNCDA